MTRDTGENFCNHPHHPPDCRVILNYPTKCWHCDQRVILYQCDRGGPVVLEPPDKGAHIPAHCQNPPQNEEDTPLSPLVYPAKNGDVEQIKILGQSPNIIGRWIGWEDKDGRTSLFFAAENGHAEVIEALAQLGENPLQRDKHGRTPFIFAAMNNHADAIKTIARFGGNRHQRDLTGHTALDYAMLMNAPDAVIALSELEKIPDLPEFLHAAMRGLILALRPDEQRDRGETIKVLHDLGDDFERVVEDGLRPIHMAAKVGSWTAVTAFAKYEVNLEAKCNSGFTPMHWAAHGDYKKVIEVLCECGATVNSGDGNGETPLDWAHNKGSEHAIPELKRRGGKRKREL